MVAPLIREEREFAVIGQTSERKKYGHHGSLSAHVRRSSQVPTSITAPHPDASPADGKTHDAVPAEYNREAAWCGVTVNRQQTDEISAKGFRAIKMKIGRPDLASDLKRVQAMRKHLGVGVPLLLFGMRLRLQDLRSARPLF